ncbi:sugar phosphate isomerase/epimerase family protein [Cytobacillus praedii]|uniref:sugar phosphate isomerase/epimerase family protein n=1 Tax=Cytobacillus praedii TaxID=1742358 RepID=UPI002E1A8601|nr:sugar phosphate isomerase/epimerase [Cytobacillus praedii]
MKLSISTYTLFSQPIDGAITQLVNSGWKLIELMGEGEHHGERLLEMDDSQLMSIAQFAKENKVSFGFHLPIKHFNPALVDRTTEELWNNCLRIVRILEMNYVLLHPGLNPSVDNGIDSTSRFIKEMLEDLPKETKLVIENVPPAENVIGSSIDQLITIIQKVNDSRVSIMLDTGHCYMNSKEAFIQECGKAYNHLFGIHINDNHGKDDEHLAIGEGDIPFKQLLLEYKEKDCVYVLETNSVEGAERSRRKITQFFD